LKIASHFYRPLKNWKAQDNKNINKGSGRLLDINTTVSVVVGLSLIPTAWFKEK
jgi:hypothetical protein